MPVIDICDVRGQLFELVERAAAGESFIIAMGGKPLVRVIAVDAATGGAGQRLGFSTAPITVPDDFNTMGSGEIESWFGGAT
jgi:antitoxin (DNA-binding transcriptional repressor) of toxin-antitoxin stability system